MKSYRESHLDSDVASQYDHFFENRVDSLIWNDFVKPWLRQAFSDARKGGAEHYLDFACGTGRVLNQGVRYFENTTGIDISSQMLTGARTRVPDARLLCLDVTREASDGIGTFDCVSMFRFLRNAEDDLRKQVLDWIWWHTSDDAILIVNNHGHSKSIPGVIQRLAFWVPREERNLLSRTQVFSMLQGAGFTVVECRGFQILPGLFGRPMFGRKFQGVLERVLLRLGLGRFGYEQVLIAKRLSGRGQSGRDQG